MIHMIASLIFIGIVKIDTWVYVSCYMDLSNLFYIFLALCLTKSSCSFTKISKLVEASPFKGIKWVKVPNALHGSVVPLAMFWWWSWWWWTRWRSISGNEGADSFQIWEICKIPREPRPISSVSLHQFSNYDDEYDIDVDGDDEDDENADNGVIILMIMLVIRCHSESTRMRSWGANTSLFSKFRSTIVPLCPLLFRPFAKENTNTDKNTNTNQCSYLGHKIHTYGTLLASDMLNRSKKLMGVFSRDNVYTNPRIWNVHLLNQQKTLYNKPKIIPSNGQTFLTNMPTLSLHGTWFLLTFSPPTVPTEFIGDSFLCGAFLCEQIIF